MSTNLVYPGKTVESYLWALLFCCIVPIVILVFAFVFPLLDHNWNGTWRDWSAFVVFGVVAIFSFLLGWVLASWTGTGLVIRGSVIEVTEWYGRKRILPIGSPITISRKKNILHLNGKSITIVLPRLTWVLNTGFSEVFLRLDDYDNPFQEADKIIRMLESTNSCP